MFFGLCYLYFPRFCSYQLLHWSLGITFSFFIRQALPLYYFGNNATLYCIGTQHISYKRSFLKVDRCFCKLSCRRDESYVVCFSFCRVAASKLLAMYFIQSRLKKIQTTTNITKQTTFQTKGIILWDEFYSEIFNTFK